MPLLTPLPDTAPEGDRARRRAALFLLLALVATPLSLWLVKNFQQLWGHIEPLTGWARFLAATVFGLIEVAMPIAAIAGWVLMLWFAVRSVYMPRSRATPWLDRVFAAVGVAVTFLPAVGFVGTALWAVIAGRVHFPRPARDYVLAADPIAFWQGVGFMLIAGGLCGWLAWRLWRGKLRRVFGGA